jgi:hypothetical protein
MRFDILVARALRRTRLYAILLGLALELHPEVAAIPARMPVDGSDNARVFVDEAFGDGEAFVHFDPSRLDGSELREARARWLGALFAMPAVKARAQNGFLDVSMLFLSPERRSLALEVRRGLPRRAENILVGVEARGRSWIVDPEGRRFLTDPERFALPDYVELDR